MGLNLAEASRHGVKARDEAFEALFKSEYSRVAGIANRVLADPQEAEDVAQEVFISFHRLHSASAQFAPAWLHRAEPGARPQAPRASRAGSGPRRRLPHGRSSADARGRRGSADGAGRARSFGAEARSSARSTRQRPQLRRGRSGDRSWNRTDRNFVEARRSRTAQGGHSWHIYLKELCAGWSTIRTH